MCSLNERYSLLDKFVSIIIAIDFCGDKLLQLSFLVLFFFIVEPLWGDALQSSLKIFAESRLPKDHKLISAAKYTSSGYAQFNTLLALLSLVFFELSWKAFNCFPTSIILSGFWTNLEISMLLFSQTLYRVMKNVFDRLTACHFNLNFLKRFFRIVSSFL